MAIALRGTGKAGTATNGANVTLTFDVGGNAPQTGDVVILFGGWSSSNSNGNQGPSTGGYTQILKNITGVPLISVGCWYKVMGATPDTSVVCLGNGNSVDTTAYACYVLSGVDASVLDQTTTTNGPNSGAANPTPPAIVTQSNNAMVIVCSLSQVSDNSTTAPSNYINKIGANGNDTNPSTIGMATRLVSPAGTETPASWTTWSAGNNFSYTIAIKPLVADVTVNVTGNALTSTAGTSTEQAGANVAATGSGLVSAVGTASVTAGASVSPSGNALTASVGTTTQSGTANVAPVGNALGISVGTVTVSISVDVTVNVTGNALGSSVGSTAETGDSNTAPTGNLLTSSAGSASVQADANVSATGSGLAASPGTVTTTADATILAQGSSLQSTAGTPTVEGSANVNVSGNELLSSVGSVSVQVGGNVSVGVSGNALSISVGTVTIITSGGDVTVNVVGNLLSAQAGTLSLSIAESALPVLLSPVPVPYKYLPTSEWPFRYYDVNQEYPEGPFRDALKWANYPWRKP